MSTDAEKARYDHWVNSPYRPSTLGGQSIAADLRKSMQSFRSCCPIKSRVECPKWRPTDLVEGAAPLSSVPSARAP